MGQLLASDEMGDHMEGEELAPHGFMSARLINVISCPCSALTALLPPEMLEGADGEFELDFERLDDATIRKIDVFLRQIFPHVPVAGGGPTTTSLACATGEDDEEDDDGDDGNNDEDDDDEDDD